MKQNLFVLLYFSGLVSVIVSTLQTISHNYYLIMTRQSWPDAQNYCREMYTNLATIKSYADYLQLKKESARKGLVEPAWVGLYDSVDSWRWSLNDILLKNINFMNWNLGEPNNYAGKELCVIIMGTNGYWADKPCTGLRPFICYNVNFSGADRFIGVASPLMTWSGAQDHCRKYHTDLASSLNSSDQTMLAQVSSIQGDSWFGLYRDHWKWLDGTNSSTLQWYPGQPSNYLGNENCAAVYKGLFIDEQCINMRYFFCHTISPVKKQIVRLQLKSDRSVFDPVVQSFILEQINQKLEEHFMMENITVTWRVQLDGNIFHKKNKEPIT